MSDPLSINSGCYPVWFRADLPREYVLAYWRGSHGQIANKNPAINEYLQHHFSLTDHGFWPVPQGVGGMIPPDWRMDGVTEVRINSMWTALRARLFHMRENILDEENVFDRVLAKNSMLGGSLWWTGCYQPDTGFRAAVFLRARSGARGQLSSFIQQCLGPALLNAGARELRTHVFASGTRFTWWTPGVRHDEPANRYSDAMLLIGADSREALRDMLNSAALSATQNEQKRHCVAIYAYAIDRTYPLSLDGKPQPQTWE
jgi:hypothetical protein